MTDQNRSPDEQVYQDNKDEATVREVYSNDQPEQRERERDAAVQDKAVADTFPASDPTAAQNPSPVSGDEH